MTEKQVTGLLPDDWQVLFEQAAEDDEALDALMARLDAEIHREQSWMHSKPTFSAMMASMLAFLKGDESDRVRLKRKLKEELHRERMLRERFRAWLPGEEWRDRIFRFVKEFPGMMGADEAGVQFTGFKKYQGIAWSKCPESYIFYVNERFPGRDPANFHMVFDPEDGEMIIKRVYPMELPRREGISTPARAVLGEMIRELVPDLGMVQALVVDNAANHATRQDLMETVRDEDGELEYRLRPDVDVATTPLGNLMKKLALELNFTVGAFRLKLMPFGLLQIMLDIEHPSA